MAQVNVTISGKTYRMACDDGEEHHLLALGEQLNRAIEHLRARFGEIGDQRLTVMAAITLADQQAEAERRLAAAQAEIVGLEDARADIAGRHETSSADMAGSLVVVAERLEQIAARINGLDLAASRDDEPQDEEPDEASSLENSDEDEETADESGDDTDDDEEDDQERDEEEGDEA